VGNCGLSYTHQSELDSADAALESSFGAGVEGRDGEGIFFTYNPVTCVTTSLSE